MHEANVPTSRIGALNDPPLSQAQINDEGKIGSRQFERDIRFVYNDDNNAACAYMQQQSTKLVSSMSFVDHAFAIGIVKMKVTTRR